MSQPDLTSPGRGVVVQRPKSDIYTVLLGIALTAILIACLLLFLELRRYNSDIKATGAKAVAAARPASDTMPVLRQLRA